MKVLIHKKLGILALLGFEVFLYLEIADERYVIDWNEEEWELLGEL